MLVNIYVDLILLTSIQSYFHQKMYKICLPKIVLWNYFSKHFRHLPGDNKSFYNSHWKEWYLLENNPLAKYFMQHNFTPWKAWVQQISRCHFQDNLSVYWFSYPGSIVVSVWCQFNMNATADFENHTRITFLEVWLKSSTNFHILSIPEAFLPKSSFWSLGLSSAFVCVYICLSASLSTW